MRPVLVAAERNINIVAARFKNSPYFSVWSIALKRKSKGMLKKFLQLSYILFFSLLNIWPAMTTTLSEKQARQIIGEKTAAPALTLSEFNGISLIAITPSANKNFNVPIVTAKKALKTIKQALKLIDISSPFSKSQIELLKKNGPVIIVYDPRYPDKLSSMSSVKIALFSPYHYNRKTSNTSGHVFLVIVSRHGIKWPTKEFAAVMVHELVGHGIQHLNDSWGKMRLIDMECEAWLYEEMAYQDLKIDKFSNEMINFKKQLEKQCDSFLRHLRNYDRIGAALWNKLNPDIRKLLKHFADYQKQLKVN
jgi:hypothetical protein